MNIKKYVVEEKQAQFHGSITANFLFEKLAVSGYIRVKVSTYIRVRRYNLPKQEQCVRRGIICSRPKEK